MKYWWRSVLLAVVAALFAAVIVDAQLLDCSDFADQTECLQEAFPFPQVTITNDQAQDSCVNYTAASFTELVTNTISGCIVHVGTGIAPVAPTMEECCGPIKRAIECDCTGVLTPSIVPRQCLGAVNGTDPSCVN